MVLKKTHGKIKKIINELNPNTFMIIINAVYFKGEWLNKFEKESTKKQIFYNLNKNEKKIDMMEITDHYNYFEDSNLKSIELTFNKESFSALIILPNKNLNINEFIEILDKDNDYLYTIINNLKYNKVNLNITKI